MLRRILIRLGLKCVACGGWRTVFKKVSIPVGQVAFSDRSWEQVCIKVRPCKSCGFAATKPQKVRLNRAGEALHVGEAITYKDIHHEK